MAQLRKVPNGKSYVEATRSFYNYPSDVDADQSNHYITFFINVRENAEVNFGNSSYNSTGRGERNTITVKRPPMKRLESSIRIQMPPTIEVSHKANYAEAEIGLLVASALAAGRALSSEGMGLSISNTMSTLEQIASQEGKRGLASLAEGVGATGARAAIDIGEGAIQNNRTELKFEGIDRRSFAFTFRMLPKSAEEAQTIKEIVTLFRYHALPEFPAEGTVGDRRLLMPSTFDIEYTPGQHLHRIDECSLESVQVKYGGERTQFFVDDHPVETEITLQFRELGIITKEKIAEGF